MKGLLFLSVIFIGIFCACKKASAPLVNPEGLTGSWTWSSSQFGPAMVFPPSDSIVTISLNSDNSYAAFLNGQLILRGTYRITLSANGSNFLHFNNLPSTVFDTASTGGGSVTYGYARIGKLFLFVDEQIYQTNDGLQFVQSPIHPEDYISNFRK